MKRICSIAIMFLVGAAFASAQIGAPTSDVLGAHLNYGRGCTGCHAPHSGAWGNGINKSKDTAAGTYALWGEDVGNLYGKTLAFGDGGKYVETLPTSLTAGTSEVSGLLTCLSCHDGNYAQGAMMKNQVYETLPSTYGTANTIPTLLGNNGDGVGNYIANHPVGAAAIMSCGGQYNWDCTITGSTVNMTGPNSSQFVQNYGFFVSPGSSTVSTTVGGVTTTTTNPIVVCTTCHNQHLMNIVKVTNGPKSGLPSGMYTTMFFIRAPYNPASGTANSNQTAQFCRQCHGGEANESNGSYTIPTTF